MKTKKKDGVLLTSDGLEHLKSELDDLKNVKLAQVIDRVARAREDGDLSENSAYIFAKQEQEFIEGRISELEDILSTATFVTQSKDNKSVSAIDLGSTVTLMVGSKKITYSVVGDWEADPVQRKISGSSPLGKALIGKKVGDKIEVEAPVGKVVYSVLAIE